MSRQLDPLSRAAFLEEMMAQHLASERLSRELIIGTADADPQAGRTAGELTISYAARAAHLHVIGNSGSGKSRFICDLIQQDITAGHGVCLVDPHGELYDMTVNWLAQNPVVQDARPDIHPVRLNDLATTFRYNPLHINHRHEAHVVASNVTKAITSVFGGTQQNDTPLMTSVLRAICTILAKRGLPLAASKYFISDSAYAAEIRNEIVRGIDDEYTRDRGESFSRMSPREFRETVGSVARRLDAFWSNPYIERIFSFTERTASFKTMMDDRHVFLLNLSEESYRDQGLVVNFEQARCVGMLFINNIFAEATRRSPRARPNPFFLYIDEAHNVLSSDIEKLLVEARKRGLFLTLAHQTLAQLHSAGEPIYSGVMGSALLKAVFGVTFEDAGVFVDAMFSDQIDFERVKEKLATMHVTGQERVKLKGEAHGVGRSTARGTANSTSTARTSGDSSSHSTTTSESWSHSSMSGVSLTTSENTSEFIPEDSSVSSYGITEGTGTSESLSSAKSTSSSWSSTDSESYSRMDAETHGESTTHSIVRGESTSDSASLTEALANVFERRSTTTYTLEEQRYDFMRKLQRQKTRHGILSVRAMGTIGFTARDMRDPLPIYEQEDELIDRLSAQSPWISSADEVLPIREHPVLKAILAGRAVPTLEPTDYFEPMSPHQDEAAPASPVAHSARLEQGTPKPRDPRL